MTAAGRKFRHWQVSSGWRCYSASRVSAANRDWNIGCLERGLVCWHNKDCGVSLSTMGGKITKTPKARPSIKMNKETKELYYRAEFKSLGDVLNDGHLNQQEFTRLMLLLGLPDVDRTAAYLWENQPKQEGSRMTVDEYISIMSDPTVDSQTSLWRKLFAEFDTDGSGWASRDDVIKGFENMGIEVTKELRDKIGAMDADKDNRVNYGDFLKMQLLKK